MNIQNLPESDYRIFSLKALLWVIFGWTGFILTLAGYFYAWIVWVVFLSASFLITRYLLKNRHGVMPSRELILVSVATVLFVGTLSFFTTPTLFSGRDQGSISEAAVRLAQNHTLEFSTPASSAFFDLRGPGRALNFPGFFYTQDGNLITQFPLVYISWLASFYGIFGISGFIIANAILSILFLITFYCLARFFMSASWSLATLLLAATSVSIYWFPKYTLSENLALPLVWLTIFALIDFLRNQNKLNYFLIMSSAILLIFTRIEGIAFFSILMALMFFSKRARTYIKTILCLRLFLILGALFIIFIVNAYLDINFYKEIFKAIVPTIAPPQAAAIGNLKNPETPAFFMGRIFYLYGMLSFFIVSFFACIFYSIKKDIPKLVPFFVIIPSLIYFFDSHISSDHPWMLRRFSFSLLPAAIFYSALILSDWKNHLETAKKNLILKAAPFLIVLMLFIGNIPAFTYFFTFSENKNLNQQTKEFSKEFTSNDLILIDQQATQDGWSMISAPLSFLYGKNAAYFFNTQDLSKIDLKKFSNVYLIAPENKVSFYSNSTISSMLSPVNTYSFSTTRLGLGQDSNDLVSHFPEKKRIDSKVTVFKITKQ